MRSCGRFGPASDGTTFDRSSSTVFVNVGSGGRPKDGDWRVCYAIVNPARLGEPEFVEFVRVPYDYERLQKELAATPLITSFARPEQGRAEA